jgi:hypothetical protein
MGRCARHIEGRAILYADRMTDSMRQAIGETNRRRAKQEAYNREHNITPQSIVRSVDMQLARIVEADYLTVPAEDAVIGNISTEHELLQAIIQLESQMREAAKNFEFERAAALRDRIRSLKQRDLGAIFSATVLNVDPAATQSNVEPAADSPAQPSASNQSAPDQNPQALAPNPQLQQADAATASAPIESKSPKPAAKRRAR